MDHLTGKIIGGLLAILGAIVLILWQVRTDEINDNKKRIEKVEESLTDHRVGGGHREARPR